MPSVLVIEDAQDMREMLNTFISRLGFDVIEAKNGLDGIKMAQAFKPELIILDLMMPVATGDLTLGFIRSTAGLAETPVIVTSAHPNARSIAEKMGAAACLEKPFAFRELKAIIEDLQLAS